MHIQASNGTRNVLVRPTIEHTFINCQVVLSSVSKCLRRMDKLDDIDCNALSLVLHMVSNAMEVFQNEHVLPNVHHHLFGDQT